MKKTLVALAALMLSAAAPVYATTDVPRLNTTITQFGNLPTGMYIGEAAGVAVNSKGHVFIFSRGNTSGPVYGSIAAQLLEFDATGKYIREIGHNSYGFGFAHTVRVDKHDNIWTTDKGTDMVTEFSPAGKVLLVLGRKQEAADAEVGGVKRVNPPRPPIPGMFRQVTDIAWDSQDNIFVSDGYINSRVAMFDHNGNISGSFGEPGTGEGQLNTPHTIAVDAHDNVYVGDRGNGRIQVFDNHGKFIRILNQAADVTLPNDIHAIRQPPAPSATPPANKTISPGAPWAICISPPNKAGEQFLFSSDSYPGRIYKMKLDGTVVGTIGAAGKELGHFGDIHELACPTDNLLYAGEELNWRVSKIVIHP
jgi:sugar lactone lactonase YvrE